MGKKKMIVDEIFQIPEPMLDEVLDFVQFLKNKLSKERIETAITSESSLRKDWLRPEEDKAWQDL